MHERIALICSAPIDHLPFLTQRIASFPYLVAVDGGVNYCFEMKLTPHLLIGDFDSATPFALNHFKQVTKKQFPKDKDQTDLELALSHVDHPDLKEITVFGALQGRTDHTLSNLMVLTRYKGKLFFESEKERLFVLDKSVELSTKIGQVISLIPLNGPVTDVHTKGFKWELKGATLNKDFISISNEALAGNITISIGKGDLLCCINSSIS